MEVLPFRRPLKRDARNYLKPTLVSPMSLQEKLSPYVPIVKNIANEVSILPELILAIIMQESGGRIYVSRYEEKYNYLYMPLHYSQALNYAMMTEINQQRTSWGLMQIMGAVAREHGFDDYFPALCIPATNILIGSKFVSNLLGKHGSIEAVFSAYNAGSPKRDAYGKYLNQGYVDSAMGYFAEIRTWKL